MGSKADINSVTVRNKVYFLSDMHLGASYFPNPAKVEKDVVNFLDKISCDAEHIYLLGDVLDYWYEYKHCVPKGYVRFFGELARLTDSGIKVTWLLGNHDIWIFDYLPTEIGVEVIDGPIAREIKGKKFLLSHGDGLGPYVPATFKFIRSVFRNKVCQKLFSMLHPDLTIGFAHKWSGLSRANDEEDTREGKSLYNSLKIYSENYLKQHSEIDYFIYGHLHKEIRESIKNSGNMSESELIILGDWSNSGCYAEFDGENLKLNNWERKE